MTFPLVEAILQCPPEGKEGRIGICTNTLAPGMVLNELPFPLRTDVAVLGSLVVNRDGAERMILNALSHPTLEYIILFGEETMSFRPSTNLLLALMRGYDPTKKGNFIPGGKGIAFQYPSISPSLLEKFRERITVIPFFLGGTDEINQEYLKWVRPRLDGDVSSYLEKVHSGKKFYYDSLQELVKRLAKTKAKQHAHVELDPKEFQHLQPPIVSIEGENALISVPFRVTREKSSIRAELDTPSQGILVRGEDSFLLAYTIGNYFRENALTFSPLEQILMGVELSRVEMEIKNEIVHPSFVRPVLHESVRTEIPLAARTVLKPDKKFYYKIGVREGKICVQALAHDTCETVFEWRSEKLIPLVQKIASENRFDAYEQEALHRMDVGIETGRAALAIATKNNFLQDFRVLFSPNHDKFPLIVTEADSFLANHQKMITKIYTDGVSMVHADAHKGTMRSAAVLAVFRDAGKSLKTFPALYASGANTILDVRASYCAELSSDENKGAYTYGNRTRAFFGRDQVQDAIAFLRTHPHHPYVIQRFDYEKDMTLTPTPVTDEKGNVIRTRLEATHDPCLTHDIYFILNGKLQAFHIARAHNIVNAYPENIFGLHDAYDTPIAHGLGLEVGDLFMLSNRANILLLTEEQKAKRLMAEPVKPVEDGDTRSGPYSIQHVFPSQGVGYTLLPLRVCENRPNHPSLPFLEGYRGLNLIEKSVDYLAKKGATHNNPIMGTFDPRDPMVDESRRLVFFQCNEQGGALHATAVFLDGKPEFFEQDVELANYIATRHASVLKLPLGNLFYFAVPCTNDRRN